MLGLLTLPISIFSLRCCPCPIFNMLNCFKDYKRCIHISPWEKNWPPWLLTVSSRWPKWSQPAMTEPWPGPWLRCDLAVTELWSYWRCRDWAVTSPWLSCDLAVTELWPRRDWAVTTPSRDWAVIIGPGAVTTVVTVSSPWAHGDNFFSWVVSYLEFCPTGEDQIYNAATPYVAYSMLSIPCLLRPWRLKEPGHQQAWYWPNKPEYCISSIRRVTVSPC